MWEYNYVPDSDELCHYGVLGMKWGVRKANSKARNIARLTKRALNYDLKSERANRKSEKIHSEHDLSRSNKAARKAANYSIKATKMAKKALKTSNEGRQLKYAQKSAKYDYKSHNKMIDANRLSKSTGYGLKAMKWSVKSDEAAKKASKARLKIAKDQNYIAMTKRKVSAVSGDPKYQKQVSMIKKKYPNLI